MWKPRFLATVLCVVLACANAGGEWEALRDAGNAAYRAGDYAAAVEHWSAALTLAERLPEFDERYTVSLTSRASLHKVRGEYAQAETLLERCLRIDELLDTPPGASLAEYLLATLYVDQGRYEEAEPLLRGVLAFHQAGRPAVVERYPDPVLIPPDPIFLVGALHRLAQMRIEQRHYAEAGHLLMQAHVLVQTATDNPHYIAVILRRRADLALATGDAETALALAEQALHLERASGPDHRLALAGASLAQRGRALHALGRTAEADASLRESLAAQEATLGPHHPAIAQTLHALAEVALARNRPAEAADLLTRTIAIYDTAPAPRHPTAVRARERLRELQLP